MPHANRRYAIALVGCSLLVGLGLAEVLLRSQYQQAHRKMALRDQGRELCTMRATDPRLIYTYVPNTCGANAHGYGTGSASSQTSATPVPAPPHTTTAPPSTASNGPNKPVADVNCSDFPTHAAAQQWFERHGGSPSNDVAGLDRDHDGLACESLP